MAESNDYKLLLSDIINLVDSNKEVPERNYLIGKCLVNYKQDSNEDPLEEISKTLNKRFGEGFGTSNLSDMMRFYRKFSYYPELEVYTKNLEWTKILELLKLESNDEINFYLKSIVKNKWSKKKLKEVISKNEYSNFIKKLDSGNYQYDIEKITITNFKSIEHIQIVKPPRFLVFAGANSCGKSNIFESLDFLIHTMRTNGGEAFGLFDGEKNIINFKAQIKEHDPINFDIKIELSDNIDFGFNYDGMNIKKEKSLSDRFNDQFTSSFSRTFISGSKTPPGILKQTNKLDYDAKNLAEILKKILLVNDKREDIIEWLSLFIPGLNNIEVEKNNLSGKEELAIFEKNSKNPISGSLISDGTYNIISLLVLLYQSNQPQFLCIEEPENGLNPKLLKEFVELFRNVCEEEGHYIWLTTHSQTLVSQLKPSELVIVDKIDGETRIKRFSDSHIKNIRMDEAWINNLLEGGLPW